MSSVVDSFGGSFFSWFQDEVLPYLMGTLYIIVMILGIVLNSVLITTMRKRNLLQIRTNKFVFELTIVDLISCVLFIFPAIIVAFMRNWKLSDYFCYIHGTVFTMCYIVMFGLLIVMSVERAVRAKNFDLHDRYFLKSKAVNLISGVIWVVGLCIACIPHTGWVSISYDFYQAACVPRFRNNLYYTIIVFVFGFGFCFISYFVTYAFIFSARKKQLEKPKSNDRTPGGSDLSSLMNKNKSNSGNNNNKENSTSNKNATKFTKNNTSSTPKVGWGSSNGPANQKSKFAALKVRDKMKKAVTKVKVSKLFSNDDTDPDFHLAVTYFIVACLMLFLWLPYFIVSFVSISDDGLWGGSFSIVSIIAMTSYFLKPIIYLAHNKHYQSVTKETIPQKVVQKAERVRKSVVDALDKIDKVMFMSASARKKLNVTLKTTLIAKRWLARARRRIRAKRSAALKAKQDDPVKTQIQMLNITTIKEEQEVQTNIKRSTTNTSINQRKENRRKHFVQGENTQVTIFQEEQIKNYKSNEVHSNITHGNKSQRNDTRNVNKEKVHQSTQNNNTASKIERNNEIVSPNAKRSVSKDPDIENAQKKHEKANNAFVRKSNNDSIANDHDFDRKSYNDQGISTDQTNPVKKLTEPKEHKPVINYKLLNGNKITNPSNLENSSNANKNHSHIMSRRESLKELQRLHGIDETGVNFNYAKMSGVGNTVPIIINEDDGFHGAPKLEVKRDRRNRTLDILGTVYERRETTAVNHGKARAISEHELYQPSFVGQNRRNTIAEQVKTNQTEKLHRQGTGSDDVFQLSPDNSSLNQIALNEKFFYQSKDFGRRNTYQPSSNDNDTRNIASVPIQRSPNANENIVSYTDRDGYDPRRPRQFNIKPMENNGGYIPKHFKNSGASRRMSQIIDIPSQMDKSSYPMPLDAV